MSTFVNTDPTAFKGVWVFCEQREGKLMPTDFELISEGRKLADDLGVELCGLLLGDKVEGLAKELGGYGADRIIVCEHPLLKDYTTDAYTKVICDVVMEKKPEIMLIGATNIGRDLGPRCAATLHTGLTADCTHLDVDVEKYKNFLRTTSNIDVESEELIMDIIHEMAKTRTVLLISHRLANVVQSDQIYFLKDGEIRERGKHEELMALGGDYCHLYESQRALENYGKEGNV